MKNVLIPFSGGLDSTYLVWKNLKEGNHVTVTYFEIKNNNTKVLLEHAHRDHLIRTFSREFSDKIKRSYFKYKITAESIENDYGLIQVPIWMLGAFMASNDKYDEIQMGYVMNDDALGYLKEIEELFNAYQPFSCKALPKMTFPIIKKQKEEMINELPPQYLNFVYSCENPHIIDETNKEIIYSYCDNCVPCKRYGRISHFRDFASTIMGGSLIRVYDKREEKFYIIHENDFKEKDSKPERLCLNTASEEEIKRFCYSGPSMSLSEPETRVPDSTLTKLMITAIKDLSVFNDKEREQILNWKRNNTPKLEYEQLSLFTEEELNKTHYKSGLLKAAREDKAEEWSDEKECCIKTDEEECYSRKA